MRGKDWEFEKKSEICKFLRGESKLTFQLAVTQINGIIGAMCPTKLLNAWKCCSTKVVQPPDFLQADIFKRWDIGIVSFPIFFFFSCLFSSYHIWQWIVALFQLDSFTFQVDSSWDEHVFHLRSAERIRRGGFCSRLQLYSTDPPSQTPGAGRQCVRWGMKAVIYLLSNLDYYTINCPDNKILL